MKILYEDKAMMMVEKPPEVLSEPGDGDDVLSLLGGNLFLVHRLDRGTGGAMVLAKTKEAAGKLSAAVQEHKLVKEYFAVVTGVPEAEGSYRDLLFRDAAKNKSFVVTRLRRGVKEAELSYKVLATRDNLSLVRVRLCTGRTHQVRVQFASRGFPLVGDGKYGSKDNRCSTALWSCHLTLPHPFSGKPVEGVSLPPQVYPWNLFEVDVYGNL